MCGIVCAFDLSQPAEALRPRMLELSGRVRHRGPDWSGIYNDENAILAHERLAIVDPTSGKQPLLSADGSLVLAANGEIYNHLEIRRRLAGTYAFQTGSDCEVILALYREKGPDFIDELNGIFAFALYDADRNRFLVARDHMGIIPLYFGHDDDHTLYVASELKCLEGVCTHIELFPPGHYLYAEPGATASLFARTQAGSPTTGAEDAAVTGPAATSPAATAPDAATDGAAMNGATDTAATSLAGSDPAPFATRPGLVRWYTRDWTSYDAVADNPTSIEQLHDALAAAVKRQLMSDVPYGVLLSGGLDSSITSALARTFADRRVESDNTEAAWWPRLHSFSVGLEGAPDLAAAREVAAHIGTVHHEIQFTVQEGLDAIRDVIYHLETYDITTIRASTPMYLMARAIKSLGIKMVLSGEGADELFGGYLYFHKAPTPQAFHEETVRKLDKLHQYDCLRANKSLAAWGVEGRVPFLDKEFMDVAMRLNPADKMSRTADGQTRMEKWVVRKAFERYLPESVAWRQKEQFSDGVGYSWIDTLKEVVQREVPDEDFAAAAERFPVQPPRTKEEYYYRGIFEEHFPSPAAALTVPSVASVACSTPVALEWDEAFKRMNEPSGRAVAGVHVKSY